MRPYQGGSGAAAHRPGSLNARSAPASPAFRNYPRSGRRSSLRLRFERCDGGPALEVQGRTARTLQALILAGEAGATTTDLHSIGPRPSAYVLALRCRGLAVVMSREARPEGWEGRYRLITPVRLVCAGSGL